MSWSCCKAETASCSCSSTEGVPGNAGSCASALSEFGVDSSPLPSKSESMATPSLAESRQTKSPSCRLIRGVRADPTKVTFPSTTRDARADKVCCASVADCESKVTVLVNRQHRSRSVERIQTRGFPLTEPVSSFEKKDPVHRRVYLGVTCRATQVTTTVV